MSTRESPKVAIVTGASQGIGATTPLMGRSRLSGLKTVLFW